MVVFLIGFMGSGKSSIGKRLASRMQYRFLDSDKEIEKHYGKSISEIFEIEGEKKFREMEKLWLQNLHVKDTVVALGGGTFCSDENVEWVNQKGTSVYLMLHPEMLAHRLLNAKEKRPLVDSFKDNPKALGKYVAEKLAKREPFYRKASIHFDGNNVSAERLDQLARLIQKK